MTLVERARKLLDKHPPAIEGSGGNATTFAAACALVWGFGFTPEEAMSLMLEYNGRCEPPWNQRDLDRMLRNVLHRQHKEPRGHFVTGDEEKGAMAVYGPPPPRVPRKKAHDMEKLKALQDKSLPSDYAGWRKWLRERSPTDPREVGPIDYLDALYRPGERILIFEKMWGSQGDYGRVIGERTLALGQLPGAKNKSLEALPAESAEGLTFLMQPVDGKWHPVERNGRVEMSRRTKQSVERWPYILLESDKVPFELWLNCLVRMKIRVVSITHSGGRSLHALVRLDKETEEELQAEIQDEGVRETMAILGTDTQAMQSLVYPRLPNTLRKGKRMSKRDRVTNEVVRKNGKVVMEFVPFHDGPAKQALLYFNPAAVIGRSIAEGLRFERP